MATPTKTQGKTSFVREFLRNNSRASSRDVNEAWTAAGRKGSISHPVVSDVRKELGLVNQPGTTRTAAKAKSASRRSKTPSAPGKTKFVKEFLQDNRQANNKSVNHAWATAGNKGSISHPVISRVRQELGLIGTTGANGKAAPRMSETANSPGKSMFVKEFLNDHPQGHVDSVNKAWTSAGFEGTISRALVDKVRARLGLTRKLGGKSKKTRRSAKGKKLGRPRNETTAAINGQPRRSESDRTVVLNELEADIDRLIFKAMAIGDLTEIEDSLRQARRLLYGALTKG